MEALFVYLLKSALCVGLFFGIYWCFLKNETFYRFNRYFLLVGLACAVLLPFFNYSYVVKLEVPAVLNPSLHHPVTTNGAPSNPFWINFLFIIYSAVSCFFILRHIIGLLKIKAMASTYGYTLIQGCKVITTSGFDTSFSVFNYIFIHASSDTSETEKKLIMEHELAHIKQYHWIDLLTAQLICALQWFNPFTWLYMNAIKQNHEFLADQAVLQNGNSAAVYRATLINHSLKAPVFMFASPFANYNRFKRISMMLKPNSSPVKKVVVLLVIPALALFFLAFAKPKYIIIPIKNQQQLHSTLPNAQRPQNIKPLTPQTLKVKSVTIASSSLPATSAVVADKDSANSTDQSPINISTTDSVKITIAKPTPILIVDGIEKNIPIESLNPDHIESVSVWKGEKAIEKFGARGSNGVIVIISKKEAIH